MSWLRERIWVKNGAPAWKRVFPGGAGRRQAPATTPKEKHTSVDVNAIQAPKKSPLQSNDVIRTGWIANIAIEAPCHNAGMLGLDDKLAFNDERPGAAI